MLRGNQLLLSNETAYTAAGRINSFLFAHSPFLSLSGVREIARITIRIGIRNLDFVSFLLQHRRRYVCARRIWFGQRIIHRWRTIIIRRGPRERRKCLLNNPTNLPFQSSEIGPLEGDGPKDTTVLYNVTYVCWKEVSRDGGGIKGIVRWDRLSSFRTGFVDNVDTTRCVVEEEL